MSINLILNYLGIIIMGFIAAVASYFLKKATNNDTLKALLRCKSLYVGGFLYVLAALITVYLLQVLPYSVVVPLSSVTYIWTMVLSKKLLGEKVSPQKIIGVALILFGAICVAM